MFRLPKEDVYSHHDDLEFLDIYSLLRAVSPNILDVLEFRPIVLIKRPFGH